MIRLVLLAWFFCGCRQLGQGSIESTWQVPLTYGVPRCHYSTSSKPCSGDVRRYLSIHCNLPCLVSVLCDLISLHPVIYTVIIPLDPSVFYLGSRHTSIVEYLRLDGHPPSQVPKSEK